MKPVTMWIQMTLVALVVYIVVTNGRGTAQAAQGLGVGYATAISPFITGNAPGAVATNAAAGATGGNRTRRA